MSIDIVCTEQKSEAFFKMPKVLFTEKYKDLSAEAKLLYGLLTDRTRLSVKNGWCNKYGEVYVYFSLDEIKRYIGCSHDKGTRLLRELIKHNLIHKEYQGVGKPARIYVCEAL